MLQNSIGSTAEDAAVDDDQDEQFPVIAVAAQPSAALGSAPTRERATNPLATAGAASMFKTKVNQTQKRNKQPTKMVCVPTGVGADSVGIRRCPERTSRWSGWY